MVNPVKVLFFKIKACNLRNIPDKYFDKSPANVKQYFQGTQVYAPVIYIAHNRCCRNVWVAAPKADLCPQYFLHYGIRLPCLNDLLFGLRLKAFKQKMS